MPTAITVPTGDEIVEINGDQIERVGRFTAADIDDYISDRTPNSDPEELELEVRQLLTDAGYDPDALEDMEYSKAQNALTWACWIFFWELSRQGEGCPPECADDKNFYRKRNWACKQVCTKMKAIKIKWADYCSGKDKAGGLRAMKGFAKTACPDFSVSS